MFIVESGPYPQEGIGKPDFSREVSLGRVRPGITLKYNEVLRGVALTFSDIFSPIPAVHPPLAAGATEPFVDIETGMDMPIVIPVGYTYSTLQIGYGYDQDSRFQVYNNGVYLAQVIVATGGDFHIEADVVAWGTIVIDPLGEEEHSLLYEIENFGGASMKGSSSVFSILRAVGTKPLPPTKTVKCKFCGHEETVPCETTRWICPGCGKLNIFYNLRNIKELP